MKKISLVLAAVCTAALLLIGSSLRAQCSPGITPYLQVGGGSWQETNTASIAAGATVNLGPQPTSGGTWSWSGPNGYSSTSRQLTSIPLTTGANSYVATYVNTSGCKSTETFTLTMASGTATLNLNLNASSVSYGQPVTLTATVTAGSAAGKVTFYRQPNNIPLAVANVANNTAYYAYTSTVSGSVQIDAVYTPNSGSSLTSQTSTLTVNPSALTYNFSNSSAWTMSNGIVNVTYDPQTYAITLLSADINGGTTNIINSAVTIPNINTPNTSDTPEVYNVFGATTGATAGPASDSTSSYVVGSNYIDFWTDQPVDSTSTIDLQHHYVLYEGYPTLTMYVLLTHSSTAGPLTQFGDSYVFRLSDLTWTSLYFTDYSFNSIGQFSANFPTQSQQAAAGWVGGCGTTCTGRDVGKETIEYTGLSSLADLYENYIMASGATGTIDRKFITKYDYSYNSEFGTQPHGWVGSDGVAGWVVLPTMETHTGGPNQVQLLGVSQGMTIGWASSHLGGAQYNPPQGVNTSRFWGPFVYTVNGAASAANPQAIATEAELASDAQATVASLEPLWASETTMVNDGYIPLSSTTERASASVTVANSSGWSSSPYANVAILADNNVDFQNSNVGYQYWSYLNTSGVADFNNVRSGTYRLSIYERGLWGELRHNGVTLTAGSSGPLSNMTFTPENFSTSAPIWTIGTPDRSAHEFQYGNVPNGGPDLDQFPASYDYWGGLDSSPVQGAVVYYATADGSHAATNSLANFPYNFWQQFDPELYAELYNSNDTTDDGYNYVVESSAPYVGGTPATYNTPPWQIHFTTTQAQLNQGAYVEISVGLVSQESPLQLSLNGGTTLTWNQVVYSGDDAMQRSNVSAHYVWAVFEFPVSDLKAAGEDNVLTLNVTSGWGLMWDALRMEITNTSSNPTVTGWNDYTYISPTTTTLPNDALGHY